MTNPSFRLRAVALAACCGILLVGCGGGSDESSNTVMAEEPMLDPAKAASEREMIEKAVANARTAVNAVDDTATDAEVQAAEAAIAAIGTAIMDADNVPENEKLEFIGQHEFLQDTLNLSKRSRDMAMEAAQRQAIQAAIATAQAAVAAVDDGATDAEVQAAEAAIAAIGTAIMDAGNVPESEKLEFTGQRKALQEQLEQSSGSRDMVMDDMEAAQRKAIEDAIDEAQKLVANLTDAATESDVQDAEDAIMAIGTAIMNADNVPANEKSGFTQEQNTLQSGLDMAKSSRDMAIKTQMTAKKLYDGIKEQSYLGNAPGDGNALLQGELGAQYNGRNVPENPTDSGTAIMVGIGTETPVLLMENEDAMVDSNHGWEGKQYMASVSHENNIDTDDNPGPNGMYEATVYSKLYLDTPAKEGEIFSGKYSLDPSADELLDILDEDPSLVDSPAFTVSNGVQKLNEYIIRGEYDGAPGTYTCTTTAGSLCAVKVTGENEGWQLGLVDTSANDTFTASATGAVTWTFKPDNYSYQFEGTPATYHYVSYGWWIHKSEDEESYTASAFTSLPDGHTTGLNPGSLTDLGGTADYMGGAAGKYALYNSSAAERNDSGHFTAKVKLRANFPEANVTGTINEFMDADGMELPWSVDLKEASLNATGVITSPSDDSLTEDVDESLNTVWTIGGTAAKASGTWSGEFRDAVTGNISAPKVVTGTFYSEYGDEGKMVGAFGVDLHEEQQ